MHICTIRSGMTVSSTSALEPGFYELEVQVSLAAAALSGDPKGYVKKVIAEHLASCIQATGFPLGEGLWSIEFTNFAQNNFDYPRGFTA